MTNYGSINGQTGLASGQPNVTIFNQGSIHGSNVALDLKDQDTIYNSGTFSRISGDTAITSDGDLTLIHSQGIIEGTTAAINFTSFNPVTLTLDMTPHPDAFLKPEIIGGIWGGASGSDTVVLQGDGVYAGTFADFEALRVNGGLWGLLASTTFNTIDIEQGTLFVSAQFLRGDTTIHEGARLWAQTTTAFTIRNKGTLTPGDSVGELVFLNEGALVNEPTGKIIISFANARADLIRTTGAEVTLNGGQLILKPSGAVDAPYSQLIIGEPAGAGGGPFITGSFDDIIIPAIFDAQVRETAEGFVFDLFGRKSFESLAASPNQQALAQFFQAQLNGPPLDDDDPFNQVRDALETAPTPEAFQDILNQLSGEEQSTAPATTFGGTQLFMSALTGHLNDLRSGFSVADNSGSGLTLLAANDVNLRSLGQMINATNTRKLRNPMAAEPGAWVPYIRAFGIFSNLDATSQNIGFDANTGGVLVGADHWLSDQLVVGGGLGYSTTSVDFTRAGNEGDVSSIKLAAYGSYTRDNWYADGILSYSYNSYDNQRIILSNPAQSDHTGHEFSLYAGGGYMFEKGNWVYGPTGSLQFINLSEEAYQETGGGGLGLSFESNNTVSVRSTLGGKAAYMWTLDNGMLVMPEVRLRWAHEWAETEYTVNAQFIGIAGSSFEIRGRDLAAASLFPGVGVTAKLSDRFTGFVQYDGDFRSEFTNHIVNAGLKYKF
ncbi:MAG: autotransporter domain-containing protein [Nitrospinaceae bacterium]|nr:autotransporter outer membrane beta-barrel domain-containing protein [Nitrospinaceae bacterium]NIR57196.1 autotransporter outer membrane beta-barrel domain-containing protein [Nitrospinaceae bacterium]NIS87639.1 autotransporter outer membrane beta-barrel domain-containing protein [Nitrospinaceae bacterium]NIT84506.1 autotransporter outer membrane beta-barrel domain-containing protein [Nitrospinaceae bacterium]NIU46696.1 autotransporter outer membrane beta-barrel domain-containing protein [Ni